MGSWLDGIAFTTNFGQNISIGCTGRPSGDNWPGSCPGDNGGHPTPSAWNKQYSLATQEQINKALGYISEGANVATAIESSIAGTTSSGYLCGVYGGMNNCDGRTPSWCFTTFKLYFMLPVISMAANSSLQLQTGSSSSTASSAAVTQTASNRCPVPSVNAGSISISQSTQTSTSLSIANSYTTTYCHTLTNGWKVSAGVSKKDVFSVSAEYSGSVSDSETNSESASQTTTTTTTSGTTSSLTLNLLCPANIPSNSDCTWIFNAFSVTSWNSYAWQIPATFTLLGGKTFASVLGGSTTGTAAFNNATLSSVTCN